MTGFPVGQSMKYIRILVSHTDVISFGPYFKTAVRTFCSMDFRIG